MSNFIKLGPCPHCGSKDNRAEYENGYWCFGCSKLEPKTDTQSLRDKLNRQLESDVSMTSSVLSTIKEIPQKGMQWLLKYGISSEEIAKYGISWEPARKLLVLINSKTYWQARNFGFGHIKYISNGMKPLTVYGEGDTIVVVEDVLSAIKIARCRYEKICASPLLGSSMSKQTMSQLTKQYATVHVWLDRDKAKQAILIRNKLRASGVKSKAIITPKDPKEYTKTEILSWLKN